MKKILVLLMLSVSITTAFAQLGVNCASVAAAGNTGDIQINNNGVLCAVPELNYNVSTGVLSIDSNNFNPALYSLVLDTTATDTLKPDVGKYYALTLSQANSVHDFVIQLPYSPPNQTQVTIKPAGNYTGVQIIKVIYLTGATRGSATLASLYTVTFATNGLNPLTPLTWKYSSATGLWY